MSTDIRRALSVVLIIVFTGLMASRTAPASEPSESTESLRAGRNFLPTPVYTVEQDAEVLRLFKGLRVTDVSDGMDKAGLWHTGRMSAEIRPLWRDTEDFTHRFVGIAVTARYVPTNRPVPGPAEAGEHDQWVGRWYRERSPEPFVALTRKGTALVIEDALAADVGSIGSNNILAWKSRGCVGVVTSATARDTDEIAAQKVPLYFRRPGRGIRPGRNEIESINRPIVVGGALVVPGDVIVADGDGSGRAATHVSRRAWKRSRHSARCSSSRTSDICSSTLSSSASASG